MKNKTKRQPQRSKNWKLRAGIFALAPIGLIATTISVVSCGTNNRSEIIKTNLNDLNLKTSLDFPVFNQQAAFDLFIKLNPEVSDLSTSIEIVDFKAPITNNPGSLVIGAKPDTKYKGTLTISIPEKTKTNLDMMINNKTIQGTDKMNQDDAFAAFLEANNSWIGLSKYVEVSEFTAPSHESDGSLVIKAKADSNYTGTITIEVIMTADLNASNLEATVAVDLSPSPEEVFQAFLAKNQSILGNSLTFDQVELSDFQAPEYLQNGHLVITAKKVPTNKWTGTIELTIKYILSEDNFTDIINYFSDNDLFKFDVPVGRVTSIGDLAYVAQENLENEMEQYYEYDQNITKIVLVAWAWNFPEGVSGPSVEELNTKGYTLHLPKFHWYVGINHPDGTSTKVDNYCNVYWTIV